MRQYVVYVHASSMDPYRARQEVEAQERAIDLFLEHIAPRPWQVIGLFTEASGCRDTDRPQLEAARALVRRSPKAELLVASFDRVSEYRTLSPDLMDALQGKLCAAKSPATHVSRPQPHSAQVLSFARPRRLPLQASA